VREASPQPTRSPAFKLAGDPGKRAGRMSCHEQGHVIGHDLQRHHPPAVPADLRTDPPLTLARQHRAAVLGAPHHVTPQIADAICGNLHLPGHASDYTHRLRQTWRFPCRLTALPPRGA
jgi:hypothetical protein